MGNCLITRLKENINNDNLPIFNTVTLHINSGQQVTVILNSNGSYTLKALDSGYFADAENPSVHLTEESYSGQKFIIIPDLNFRLCIEGKESLTSFAMSPIIGRFINTDIATFDYCINLTSLTLEVIKGNASILSHLSSLQRINFKGGTLNVSSLSENIALEKVQITYSLTVSGEIDTLYKLINLTVLDFSNTIVSGEIKNLLDRMAANRSSGTLVISNNGSIRYNGTIINSPATAKFGTGMVNPTAEETAQGWQVVL